MATRSVSSIRTREYDVLRTMMREAREKSGMSQEGLSLALGRPITYIGKVELGTRRLDLIELMEITAVLNADVVQFVASLREALSAPPCLSQVATPDQLTPE